MKPPPITKSLFLSARICPALGWFLRNTPIDKPPSDGDLFRMEQGQEIGRLARTLFPRGHFITGGANADDASKTLRFIASSDVKVIFEATFAVGNYVARSDILLRETDGWRVIEVKSSLADTEQLDQLIDDLTYTVMVAGRAGLKIVGAELMLLSRKYRKGQPTSSLFQRLDQMNAVAQRMTEFDSLWDNIDRATSGQQRPPAKLIPECRSCPYFQKDCLGTGVEHSVLCLPRLRPTRLAELSGHGIVDVLKLPKGFRLTPTQKRVVECARRGHQWSSASLAADLSQLEWPISYLDFETVMSAIPLYEGIAPFAQITTQFSIHRRQNLGAELKHAEFLADPKRDCEEELAERLLEACSDAGSIVVYSAFEKTRIRALARRFPKLSKRLLQLTERLFDLLALIRDGFYHPDFAGSFSIKVVLPVLVPELRYDGLAIGDGDAAVSAFARMAMGMYSAGQCEIVRRNLLAYCKQDTLAMVRVHEALVKPIA